jgi:hypothetical protein
LVVFVEGGHVALEFTRHDFPLLAVKLHCCINGMVVPALKEHWIAFWKLRPLAANGLQAQNGTNSALYTVFLPS